MQTRVTTCLFLFPHQRKKRAGQYRISSGNPGVQATGEVKRGHSTRHAASGSLLARFKIVMGMRTRLNCPDLISVAYTKTA